MAAWRALGTDLPFVWIGDPRHLPHGSRWQAVSAPAGAVSVAPDVLPVLQAKDMAGNLFLANTHAKVLQVLHMADYLSPRYAVVLANPPFGKKSSMTITNEDGEEDRDAQRKDPRQCESKRRFAPPMPQDQARPENASDRRVLPRWGVLAHAS